MDLQYQTMVISLVYLIVMVLKLPLHTTLHTTRIYRTNKTATQRSLCFSKNFENLD